MTTNLEQPPLPYPAGFPSLPDVDRLVRAIEGTIPSAIRGSVWSVGSHAIAAVGFPAPMGAVCRIRRHGRPALSAQVIGFEGDRTLLASFDGNEGISPGDRVELYMPTAQLPVGRGLLGRVIDPSGTPLDGRPSPLVEAWVPLDADPLPAMARPPIRQRLETGVRTLDTLITLGRGQRIGIFAGSGVGKSTLLGMITRGTSADVIVIGLVGERGREVLEYLQRELTAEVLPKCVTVVATSDQPALRRVQAALAATAVAEYFRDCGKSVLLLMDSVTRFAMAQREIGLAAGEAPTTRGYPPSVFSMLPRLVERSGAGPSGSITGIYTVLVEGDDTNEPIADTLRGLLDGHLVLSRSIAQSGRYPAIDVLASLSRLQNHLVDEKHLQAANRLRNLLAVYQDNQDLIQLGAYQRGSNPTIDMAITMYPTIQQFLAQDARQPAAWNDSVQRLLQIAATAETRAATPPAGQASVGKAK
ncbi:MAG: flagellum-specific ATP synthase [Pirellulaceae bacterium]|nr:MAG: flagellum-specific ATP synthase [Pirellulaceae bacterium]